MIWHQIQENGLQSTVLVLIAVMLTFILTEEELTIAIVITRIAGTAAMPRAPIALFLSGAHFICNSRDGPFRSDFGTLGTLLQVSDIRLTIDEKQKEKSRCQKRDSRCQKINVDNT